jgi:hypothetical protein
VIRPRYVVPIILIAGLFLVCLLWLAWPHWTKSHAPSGPPDNATSSSAPASNATALTPTTINAHNLLLRKGPMFRIYIRWLRGQLLRTRHNQNPSLDDPESFIFLIQKGVIHANLGDIANYLNTSSPASFSLKNINIIGTGDQVKLTGTVHKLLVPLPVELLSTVSATPDGRIHLHVTKINILKIPVKGLLGGLHVEIDDIMGKSSIPGVQVTGNDLFFDTTKLLPPPHIRGELTSILVAPPDLVLIYGNAHNDEERLAQWHNFLRLKGGTLEFGKLTMHDVDFTLIDASTDPWFDLDLVNYQAQLENGYTRVTPQAGLEIFMPDLDEMTHKKTAGSVTLDWLKDRNRSLPPDVPVR